MRFQPYLEVVVVVVEPALAEEAKQEPSTEELAKPWCISVFKDNAGIVKFDDKQNVCIKVETHNHPSAIEPYGGANTGIGGVIREAKELGLIYVGCAWIGHQAPFDEAQGTIFEMLRSPTGNKALEPLTTLGSATATFQISLASISL